jgi:pilus assembly protein Flp/PilA
MTSFARRFLVNNSGATAIEYGLIAALIAVVCIGAFSRLGNSLKTKFTNVTSALDGATSQ